MLLSLSSWFLSVVVALLLLSSSTNDFAGGAIKIVGWQTARRKKGGGGGVRIVPLSLSLLRLVMTSNEESSCSCGWSCFWRCLILMAWNKRLDSSAVMGCVMKLRFLSFWMVAAPLTCVVRANLCCPAAAAAAADISVIINVSGFQFYLYCIANVCFNYAPRRFVRTDPVFGKRFLLERWQTKFRHQWWIFHQAPAKIIWIMFANELLWWR